MSDYDFIPPPDDAYFMPDDPFPDDLFDRLPPPPEPDAWLPDDDDFVPDDSLLNVPPLSQDGLQGFEPAEPDDVHWSWHDARLIGVDRGPAVDERYEVGAIDLYANVETGDLGGVYLPVARFTDPDAGMAYLHDLEDRSASAGVIAGAEQAVLEQGEDPRWRSAALLEYEAYEHQVGVNARDFPPDDALEPLLETAQALGATLTRYDLPPEDTAQALHDIGIQSETFDPVHQPPPFHDPETGLHYWIGVFQPDRDDREHCVTAILSLGRSAETGQMEAQLAPCVPGDWDKTYAAAEYLIEIARKGGIEPVFDAAEGMALATDQRDLWENAYGLALEPDAAQELADATREQWDIPR